MVVYSEHSILLATCGGVIIGLSAFLQLQLKPNQIMGVSGMFKGTFRGIINRKPWAEYETRLFFIAGLLASGALATVLYPTNIRTWEAGAFPTWRVVLSGLLVGCGTSLGNGCTSGHGICGLARLSKRSLVATLTFMSAGVVVASASNGSKIDAYVNTSYGGNSVGWDGALGISVIFLVLAAFAQQQLVSFLVAASFGVALAVAGMTDPSVVIAFLDLHMSRWNPTLAFVMIGGLAVNLPLYQLVTRKAVNEGHIQVPNGMHLDVRLILGATLFGSGWGIAGVCPGPAIVSLLAFNPITSRLLWLWFLLFLFGQSVVVWYDSRKAQSELISSSEPLTPACSDQDK